MSIEEQAEVACTYWVKNNSTHNATTEFYFPFFNTISNLSVYLNNEDIEYEYITVLDGEENKTIVFEQFDISLSELKVFLVNITIGVQESINLTIE